MHWLKESYKLNSSLFSQKYNSTFLDIKFFTVMHMEEKTGSVCLWLLACLCLLVNLAFFVSPTKVTAF